MARPLKIFTVHGHVSHLPSTIINDVLGAPRHVSQGRIYVVAHTKKAASARLAEVLGGRPHPTNVIDEASDTGLVAFIEATAFLGTDSDLHDGTVAASYGNGDKRFAVLLSGGWTLVGHTTYKNPENERDFLSKPVFVPIAQEEKPKAEPRRVTIEFDADMDPELIERLIGIGRCTITFGRITAHEVVGKVVG